MEPRKGSGAAPSHPPLIYEDAELLIIDKPAGLAVHPGPRTPRSLEDHLPALSLGFRRLPQPAHRLDRDTSGCLVLARNPRALKQVSALFEAGAAEKTYIARLAGEVAGEGVIDAPLRKISSRDAGWRMVVGPSGAGQGGAKRAVTAWRVLQSSGGTSLVEFRPQTGRTHQIRVHAAHALAPIIGDPVYGAGPAERMYLHAARIAFPWRGARQVSAAAPLPPQFGV
ncbi:RluA family pseudouridine synthase [Pacificimonas flava]|uniref:Pseudouridylate synthase n=1 Tax=Pacificimonas flava TaxID=1234595 RepID=M2SC86_9SPHN|nr:RluA family pseudouridine synthase [Pacificimonas flava]EMD82985.1 Pseudouridylate synthase [Pacificimonas flava]MBB5280145.1 tRNA pseudouridine32 synthase/23S rRNA pseudouridine746 synthase [Pacificimonas flava]